MTHAAMNPITEDDIANFLVNTPDFFERHAELLSTVKLTSPHSHRAISLQERQAETRAYIVQLKHDAQGVATVKLAALPPGPYRLRYETTDDFGSKAEAWRDFIVAGGAGATAGKGSGATSMPSGVSHPAFDGSTPTAASKSVAHSAGSPACGSGASTVV